MGKMLVLLLALLLIFSGSVMAQEDPGVELDVYTGFFDNPFDPDAMLNPDIDYYQGYFESLDDGIVVYNEASADIINLKDINRSGINLDGLVDDGEGKFGAGSEYQAVEVELPAYAYIPSFLEVIVSGNQGTTSFAKFGPSAQDEGNYDSANGIGNLIFDNELGGFVDGDWNSLGSGVNVEFNLQEELNAFIRGCDIFAVVVVASSDYRYAVAGKALVGPGGSTLDIYMRTHLGPTGSWLPTEAIFTGTTVEEEYTMENIAAGTESVFVHDFKVPFDPISTHGEYTGAVYFRAATI